MVIVRGWCVYTGLYIFLVRCLCRFYNKLSVNTLGEHINRLAKQGNENWGKKKKYFCALYAKNFYMRIDDGVNIKVYKTLKVGDGPWKGEEKSINVIVRLHRCPVWKWCKWNYIKIGHIKIIHEKRHFRFKNIKI